MSDFNYGLEPGVQSSGSSKLRFVLIFAVVSALIAAVLWWFWPRSNEENSAADPGKQPQVEVDTARDSADKKEEKSSSETSATAEKNSEPQVKEEEKKASVPAQKEVPSPVADDPTDPVLPAKGVITPADQNGADLPVVPVDEKNTEENLKLLEESSKSLAKGDFAGAEKYALQALIGVAEYSKIYRQAWQCITAARMGMVSKGTSGEYVVRYRIRSGDTLSGIAGRFFTTVELLRKRNNITGSRIFVGKTLFITPGDWKISVSKKYRVLKLFRKANGEEKLFALWEVGIGRMGKTPSAEFAIASRVSRPDWYLADGRVIKYGDPENQLGEYFLKLAPVSSPGKPLLGYGIHGAKDETTVGRSLSSGCVRMRSADVEALYYLVPAGCRVEIKEN